MWEDDSWCLCCHIEDGFAIICAPGILYEAFALLTDSEGGIIFHYGYSKYFVQLCSAFPTRKERMSGKAGAKLAMRHHSQSYRKGRWLKKKKKRQINNNSLSDNTAWLHVASSQVLCPHPTPWSNLEVAPWELPSPRTSLGSTPAMYRHWASFQRKNVNAWF